MSHNQIQKQAASKGSFSLTVLFSTFGGLAFALLFYNFVQFVAANAALREAARKGARCLTPTDPACVQLQLESASGLNQEWWGYTGGSSSALVSLDYYRYTGNLTRLTWQAAYDTFSLHKAFQAAVLDVSHVPVRTYRPLFSPAAKTVKSVYASPGWYTPRYPFPAAEDYYQAPAAYFLAMNPGFHPLLEASQIIGRNTVGVFTASASIPALPDAQAPCRAVPGGPGCDAGTGAGGTADFHEYAFIALKVFANVRAINGRASVRWRQSSQERSAGLWLDIYDRYGNRVQQSNWEDCLGGRAEKDVGRSFGEYNLILRGTAGVDYGSPAVCPNNKRDHWNIKVPRGGRFAVRAYLLAERGPVEAQVRIDYFYDDYDWHPERQIVCEKQVAGDEAETCPDGPYCLPAEMQKPDDGWHRLSCSLAPGASQSAAVVGEGVTTAAVCSPQWRPDPAGVQVPPDMTLAGWEVKEDSVVRLPGIFEGCQSMKEEISCEGAVMFGAVPGADVCPLVYRAAADLQRTAEEINARQPAQAPKFPVQNPIMWGAQSGDYWEFSWMNDPRYAGAGQLAVRPETIRTSRYKYLDEAANQGGSLDFALGAIAAQEGARAAGAGWEEFRAQAASRITITKTGEERIELSHVYPFKEVVPEIYYGQNTPGSGWDFDRDCILDSSCAGNRTTGQSLSEALRPYAAAEVREAGDPSISFETTAAFDHTEIFSQMTAAEAHNLSFPECTPTKMVCDFRDAVPIRVGLSGEMPEECRNGTYAACYSLPYGFDYKPQEMKESIDENLVRRVTLDELQRIIPYAREDRNCGDKDASGCISIGINLSGTQRASLALDYRMPVTFPLNRILGQDTIPVRYTKVETVERPVDLSR